MSVNAVLIEIIAYEYNEKCRSRIGKEKASRALVAPCVTLLSVFVSADLVSFFHNNG